MTEVALAPRGGDTLPWHALVGSARDPRAAAREGEVVRAPGLFVRTVAEVGGTPTLPPSP